MKLLVAILLCSFSFTLAESPRKQPADRPSFLVGGQDIGPQYPFVGQVWIKEQDDDGWRFCTGSLIHRRWLLTAAHCYVEGAKAKDMDICMRADGCPEARHYQEVSDFEIRPNYGSADEDGQITLWDSQYDQMLLRFRRNQYGIDPVPLSTTTEGVAFAGAQVGWGMSKWEPDMEREDTVWPETLQFLPVLARRESHIDLLNLFDPIRIIFEYYDSYVAPGDSGGPLLIWTLKGWTLVGVLSTSDAEGGFAINSAITGETLDWIDETLDDYGDRR